MASPDETNDHIANVTSTEPKGFEKPEHWPSNVRADPRKWVYWLPENWGQGLKTTSTGRDLRCYISPCGQLFYHKGDIEKRLGRALDTRAPNKDSSKKMKRSDDNVKDEGTAVGTKQMRHSVDRVSVELGDFFAFLQCQLRMDTRMLLNKDIDLEDPKASKMWQTYRNFGVRNVEALLAQSSEFRGDGNLLVPDTALAEQAQQLLDTEATKPVHVTIPGKADTPSDPLVQLLDRVNSSRSPSARHFFLLRSQVDAHVRNFWACLPPVVAQIQTSERAITAATLQEQLREWRQYQIYIDWQYSAANGSVLNLD